MDLKVPNFPPENGSETQTTHRHLCRSEGVKIKDCGAEPVKRREEEVALAPAWKWEISHRGKGTADSLLRWCVPLPLSSPSSPGPSRARQAEAVDGAIITSFDCYQEQTSSNTGEGMDNAEGGEPDPTDTIDVLKCMRCAHAGCTNVPSWGYDGGGPTVCSEHAAPVMVQIVALRCREPHCTSRRTFGFDGTTAQLCAVHKLDGMVDFMKRRNQCVVPNCTKLSTYGFDGFLARFCFSHKFQGMVYLKNRKRCEYYECTRQPTYGIDGQQAKFCSSHKEEGMIDVKNCRCKHPGCTRQPNYGHEGGRAKFCSSHKMAKMVNVVSRRCEFPGCKRQPTYGFEGEKATFCPQHRLETMVDVVNRHCEFSGCTKTPSYGYVGERAQFCSNHHLPEMEDVKNRRCEWHECRRYPIFGREGERARFCSSHKADDMVNVRNRKCEEGNCSKVPTHGFPDGKARYCLAHAQPGMVNLKGRRSFVNTVGPPKHEDDVDPRLLEASARITAHGRQPGPSFANEARGVLGGMPDGEAVDRSSRLAGVNMGPRGPGNGGHASHETHREHMFGGQGGAQGPSPVMGWGEAPGMHHGGGVSNVSGDGVLAGVLAHQREYGSTLRQEEQARWSRSQARESAQEEARQKQARVLGSEDLTQEYPRLRPYQHGYRDHQQKQEEEPSRSYGNMSPPHGLLPQINMIQGLSAGDGGGEVSSPPVSGVLGGRVTLPPPQRRIPVAQPRARRPLPPSPGRGGHGIYGGIDETALAGGRQGGSLSPFLGHQPSAHLRLPLPPVPPATSGPFPSDFRPVDWYDSQGESGNPGDGAGKRGSVPGRGAGDAEGGGNGRGGSGNGSAWNKVGLSMGNVEYSHQSGEEVVLGGIGGGGIAGGGDRGATTTSSGSLMDGGTGLPSTGNLGTRLSSVDLGHGLMHPLDHMQNMTDSRNPSPGPFPNMGQEMSGASIAGHRPNLSSPPAPMGDAAAVGVSTRPLSPLMSAIGDPVDSPPGIPRLRTLNSRRLESHAAVSSPYQGNSSSTVPSASLEGFQRGIQSSVGSTGPHRTSLQTLPGQPDEGVVASAEGGRSSRAPLAAASGAVHDHEGVGVVGHDGWVQSGVVGSRGVLDPTVVAAGVGQGGHEGDDEDPRKHLRIEQLLH